MSIKTIVVNLYAGPGAGKTTSAWEIASRLKKENITTEYVSEYAKELVWENNARLLDGSLQSQTHLFEEQNWRLQRLQGKVSVAVTDSPILLSLIYGKEITPALRQNILDAYHGYNNFDMFIQRGTYFEQAGRIHNLVESKAIDSHIHTLLRDNGIFYGTYTHDRIDTVIANIKRSLQYNRNFKDTPIQAPKPRGQPKPKPYVR